jgi:hypothetical protein
VVVPAEDCFKSIRKCSLEHDEMYELIIDLEEDQETDREVIMKGHCEGIKLRTVESYKKDVQDVKEFELRSRINFYPWLSRLLL